MTKCALVPIEPTPEMLKSFPYPEDARETWARMLAAAPQRDSTTPSLAPKPLDWSDPQKPNDKCGYDHVTAETPFGNISIEWKSWKRFGGHTIYASWATDGYIGSGVDLANAKQIAEEEYRRRLALAMTGLPVSVPESPSPVTYAGGDYSEEDLKALMAKQNHAPMTLLPRVEQIGPPNLARAVLAWWEKHEHDSIPNDGDGSSYPAYDETPEFVRIAQALQIPVEPLAEDIADHRHNSGSESGLTGPPDQLVSGPDFDSKTAPPADVMVSGRTYTLAGRELAKPCSIEACPQCFHVFPVMTAAKYANQCLQNAEDDEPIFVLRAQDALAPQVVRHWAEFAMNSGVGKAAQAFDIANAMERWPNRKVPD